MPPFGWDSFSRVLGNVLGRGPHNCWTLPPIFLASLSVHRLSSSTQYMYMTTQFQKDSSILTAMLGKQADEDGHPAREKQSVWWTRTLNKKTSKYLEYFDRVHLHQRLSSRPQTLESMFSSALHAMVWMAAHRTHEYRRSGLNRQLHIQGARRQPGGRLVRGLV